MHKDSIHPLFIGKEQVNLPSCHSTNAVAADLLAANEASEGMLVITDHQTKGRGQRGNSWEAEPAKNLTFSVILMPKFLPVNRQFELNIVTSLALIETLKGIGLKDIAIKWPNDVIIGEAKIAGILIENAVRAATLESSVIGIGLNVNQSNFKVKNATSIYLQTGKELHLSRLLNALLSNLQHYYLQLRGGATRALKRQYLAHLYWLGETHKFKDINTNTTFEGSIQGVDPQGRLHIQALEREYIFEFKQVAFLE